MHPRYVDIPPSRMQFPNKSFDDLPILVDVYDTARLLSVSSRKIRQLAESGILPPVQIGPCYPLGNTA